MEPGPSPSEFGAAGWLVTPWPTSDVEAGGAAPGPRVGAVPSLDGPADPLLGHLAGVRHRDRCRPSRRRRDPADLGGAGPAPTLTYLGCESSPADRLADVVSWSLTC